MAQTIIIVPTNVVSLRTQPALPAQFGRVSHDSETQYTFQDPFLWLEKKNLYFFLLSANL